MRVGRVGRYAPVLLGIVFSFSALRCFAAPPEIANAGFEAEPVTSNWEVTVYGAKPEITRDTREHHAGAASLRIHADSASDTALGQELMVTPGAFYRLTGWVKTAGLKMGSARVVGTIQVQRSHGEGVIASGPNTIGDTPWTRVAVPFTAPEDGRIRLCLFFAGFGRGAGTAWFDDLKMEEVNPTMSVAKITADRMHPDKISPMQYGQFIEHLCTLVPAMWAEKLYDGSFEGLSPYKFVYLKEIDFKERPWFPVGATNRGLFELDSKTHVSGHVSKRITAQPGAPCTLGIAQDSIAVQKGVACKFSVYLKRSGFTGPVKVAIQRDAVTLASGQIDPAEGDAWKKYTLELNPTATASDAVFSIQFRGPGVLWLDNASLMPVNNVGGWRPDVVEALRALKPGVIRYGGSTLDDANLGDFKWRDAVGNPDTRMPFTAWGGLQPAAAGLEEIVQLCYAVGAEPLICIRFEHNTPKEAAAEVEYFNGAENTPMGAIRAANGHAKPYGIKFWQVGNERAGEAYENGLASLCAAMREVDPNIQILSSYPTPGVLKNASEYLNFVSPHQYDVHDLSGTAAQLDSTRQMIAEYGGGHKIKVGVTEWNTTAGDAGPPRAMLWNLENALACSRYQNLIHRNCDLVEIANRSNLTNSFCSGIIQTDNHRLYKTPTYYAQQLYSTLAGDYALAMNSDLPSDFGPDISATISADGKTVTLFAINFTGETLKRPMDLSALIGAETSAEIWTLADREAAGEPDVTNSFAFPERIIPVKSKGMVKPHYEAQFAPYSLTVLRFHVTRR